MGYQFHDYWCLHRFDHRWGWRLVVSGIVDLISADHLFLINIISFPPNVVEARYK